MLGSQSWGALGTSVRVVVTDGDIEAASLAVSELVDEVDRTYSRFRADSELSQLNAHQTETVTVSPLLALATEAALRGARLTDGLVDPTVGRHMRLIGYDDDFALIHGRTDRILLRLEPVPGWRGLQFDAATRAMRLPRGVELDLGSTGKALAADLAAAAAMRVIRHGGVLVSLGGDIAVAGDPPEGGWNVLVTDDSSTPVDGEGEDISIRDGALATSSTTVRRWTRDGVNLHHILDPRTGLPAAAHWRTVSVTAATCVDANIAATAAVIRGADAPQWLESLGLAARLVTEDGDVVRVGGWPTPSAAPNVAPARPGAPRCANRGKWPSHDRGTSLVRDACHRHGLAGPADRGDVPRPADRVTPADRGLATLPDGAAAPQPRAVERGVPGHPRGDRGRGPVRGTRRGSGTDPVLLPIPAGVARPRRRLHVPGGGDDRHEPAARPPRPENVARDPLGGVCSMADSRPARPGNGHGLRRGLELGGQRGLRAGRGRVPGLAAGVPAQRGTQRGRGTPRGTPRRLPMNGAGSPTLNATRLLAGPMPAAGAETYAAQTARLGLLPSLAPGVLIPEIERSGLLGRGGAAFPVGTKWRHVAERAAAAGGAVVVANGAEGEPRSHKDRTLMAIRPHLVIDGGVLAARSVGADELILYVGADHLAALAAMERALAERPASDRLRIRLVQAPPRYVSGESSAVVHFLNDGDARPTAVPPRPYQRGVRGKPTVVQNVESLAYAALIARYGADWYRTAGATNRENGTQRGAGTAGGPALTGGTALTTVLGAGPAGAPRVCEIEYGTTLRQLIATAGGQPAAHDAVLIGGYFGGWARVDELIDAPLDPVALAERGASFGCGMVALLPASACGVRATADVLRYMAGESARQCGPCVFGLGAIAAATQRLAAGAAQQDDLENLHRWAGMVRGRGGCHHPDGAAGQLESALRVFEYEFQLHESRRCSAGAAARDAATGMQTAPGIRTAAGMHAGVRAGSAVRAA